MSKSKTILVMVGIFVLVAGMLGGAVAWGLHSQAQAKAKLALEKGEGTTLGDATGGDSISLNSGQSSGLSVSGSGTANNLGQLTPNNGTQSGGSSGSGSSSSSSSSQSPFDPKTFTQYEKYKDSKDALFGDVEKGDGAELGMNMKAVVYYKGWLTDGTLFDQTKTDAKGQKQAFEFTEGAHEVIPGWEQGVAGMKVGGTRLIIVPPGVGYGAQGQGPIPPNSVLIFQVQLISAQ